MVGVGAIRSVAPPRGEVLGAHVVEHDQQDVPALPRPRRDRGRPRIPADGTRTTPRQHPQQKLHGIPSSAQSMSGPPLEDQPRPKKRAASRTQRTNPPPQGAIQAANTHATGPDSNNPHKTAGCSRGSFRTFGGLSSRGRWAADPCSDPEPRTPGPRCEITGKRSAAHRPRDESPPKVRKEPRLHPKPRRSESAQPERGYSAPMFVSPRPRRRRPQRSPPAARSPRAARLCLCLPRATTSPSPAPTAAPASCSPTPCATWGSRSASTAAGAT